jgi:hypothetical protein
VRLPDPFNILATADRIDAAATEEEVRAIVDNWRATHWRAWVEDRQMDKTGRYRYPDAIETSKVYALGRVYVEPVAAKKAPAAARDESLPDPDDDIPGYSLAGWGEEPWEPSQFIHDGRP